MDLGKYIHQLLKHRNEVFVKGLGTFKRIHTSSVFDERKSVYLPPVTYLEFDAKSANGVDFIDYVQQSFQLGRQEAEALVEEQVIKLMEDIKDHGLGQLNHLGQFIKHGQSLVFKAEDLSGFQLQPVEGDKTPEPEPELMPSTEPEAEVEVPEEEPVIADPEAEEVQVEEPVLQEVAEPVELIEEPVRSSSNTVWYVIALLVALGIIGGLFYANQNKETAAVPSTDSLAQEQPIVLPVDTAATLPTDSLTNSLDSLAQDTLAHVVEEKKPLIPANHHWQIVIGSHRTLAQAYEQAESFNKAGITSVRVVPSKLAHNLKKVIWDSYETKEQVDSALRYVQKHYMADAWPDKINK